MISKVVAYSMVLTLLAVPCHAEFRGFKWGTTESRVKAATEGKPLSKSPNSLVYEDKLLGIEVLLHFGFEHNKLVRGGYFTKMYHFNNEEYLSDYHKIKESLIQKYGIPSEDDETIINTKYQQNLDEIFEAIQNKEFSYYCRWNLKDKIIKLTLSSDPPYSFKTSATFQKPGDEERLIKKLKKEEDSKL